jgi:murein DD-endopeptidase / murein LD-carboxypeptidase
MTFKTFLLLFLTSTFLISCKTSSSSIVTSKDKAQQMGIYKVPEPKVSHKTTKKEEKETIAEKKNSKNNIKEAEDSDYITSTEGSSYLAEQITTKAKQFQGVRYKTGGTSTSGMDCSGFIIASFSDYNIKLPRTSNEMSRTGIEINKEQAKKGDLIFFKTNGRSVINHVGMILEVLNDDITFIHSSTKKGVIISSTKDTYYGKTLARINRVIQ